MQKTKRWKRKRDRWGQREGEKKAESLKKKKKKGSEWAAVPAERDCCFLCMLSVGLPPVSMRQMQPGVLGNYRGEPPSEHMCFPHTNLHKDSTWPVCFSTFHPYLNNRQRKKQQRIHQNCGYVVARVCFSLERRNTFQTATSATVSVLFCDEHLSETSHSSVWLVRSPPLCYRAELRSSRSAFQQVFVDPTVGEPAPANSW